MKHILLLISFSLAPCTGLLSAPEPPNILWITHEDASPAWGAYGDAYAWTPNIDALAKDSYRFTRASSNAPICAPARSTLITGMYTTSLGTQNLRSIIPVPDDLKILPELLREAGYYTTNNVKTDYNFSHEGRWDESSNTAHWRNGPDDKPFFSVFNFMITHEGPSNRMDKTQTEVLEEHHDPARANLPPYYPETDRFREIWAHSYDLMTVFDQGVGKIIAELKEDGEFDNTIIFVFSDHGWGLPRYKRWLYNSGLEVPFILHVPEKYKNLVPGLTTQVVDKMVSFVDFAPSVLALAGVEAPERMEGRNFLSEEERDYSFGYRDRADDVYDMSRSVSDGRYMYIRNFIPQLPYIQNAVIFNQGKAAYNELFRVRENEGLPEAAEAMFNPKAPEELYDLENDPWQLENLLENPEERHVEIAGELREVLFDWMITYHDTGLLNEGLMMARAEKTGTSVYEMTHSPAFDGPRLLEEAHKVGLAGSIKELSLTDKDNGVQFWALIALENLPPQPGEEQILESLLADDSPVIASQAAMLVIDRFDNSAGFEVLKKNLVLDSEPLVLQTAIFTRWLDEKACPIHDYIRNEAFPKWSGQAFGRYKNWYYAMFVGMAMDQIRNNCGEDLSIEF